MGFRAKSTTVVALLSASCGLFPDLSDLGGDASADAFTDVAVPVTCDAAPLTCVLAAPSGWIGPLELYEGDAGFPTCPGAQIEQVKGFQGFVAPSDASTCTACDCNTQPATCSVEVTGYAVSASCAATPCGTGTIQANMGSCQMLQNVGCAGEMSAVVTGVVGTASCTTSGGAVTGSDASWGGEVLGCIQPPQALVRADCVDGYVCAPKPVMPFGPTMCVAHDGDMACPFGYASKHTLSKGVADTRACTPCKCTVATAPCTNIALELTGGPLCNSPEAGAVSACVNLVTSSPWLGATATPPSVTCTVDGGSNSGTIVEGPTVTVCCQ
jgi:hypothetical protein